MAELAAARKADAIAKQQALKAEADKIELEYVNAYKAAWQACLKLIQLSTQEQTEFCGQYALPATIDGGRWGVEAQKLESWMESILGVVNPGLLEKAGLTVTDRNKIKARIGY